MTAAGVAFSAPDDGDIRGNVSARRRLSRALGIPDDWATVDQVHGARAVLVTEPGKEGEADAIVTSRPGLPAAVFTADCLGVVIHARGAVGVAHAGWRGLSDGILESTVELMEEIGESPREAHLGPAIGPCCFEVGEEVAELFPLHLSTTSTGATSVDLVGAARSRLRGIPASASERCTACGGGPSHRRDRTTDRMAAVGWLP